MPGAFCAGAAAEGLAHETERMRWSYPWPSSLAMAAAASCLWKKLMKAKPRLCCVSRSLAR